MSMDYIRQAYKVPAKRGRKVRLPYSDKIGIIVGSQGASLRVKIDPWHIRSYHPWWKIEYLDDDNNVLWPITAEEKKCASLEG